MTITIFVRKLFVHIRTIGTVTLIFLFITAAHPQDKSSSPLLWYHPDTKLTAAEHGDVSELKDKHRVCVSISPGLTSAAFQDRLRRQLFQELKDYPALEIVKDPNAAELAILIRIRPASALAESRPMMSGVAAGGTSATMAVPTTSESYVSPMNDLDFFVLTRGNKRNDGVYVPRVIIQRHHTEAEPNMSGAVLDLGSVLKKLKSLQGEK